MQLFLPLGKYPPKLSLPSMVRMIVFSTLFPSENHFGSEDKVLIKGIRHLSRQLEEFYFERVIR
jgi:hypothetical protein